MQKTVEIGQWDHWCTLMAMTLPASVVIWFFPPLLKIGMGVIWIPLTLLSSARNPPVGLFFMLTGMFNSLFLFSQNPLLTPNWGKIFAIAFVIGLLLHRDQRGQYNELSLIKLPKSLGLWLFIIFSVTLAAINNSQEVSFASYMELVITTLIFVLIYNAITTKQQLFTMIIGMIIIGLTVILLQVIAFGITIRFQGAEFGEFSNPNAFALLLSIILPFIYYLIFAGNETNKSVKLWAVFCLSLYLFIMIVCASRAALLSALIGIFVWWVAVRPPLKTLILAPILLSIIIVFVPAEFLDSIWSHFMNANIASRISSVERQEFLEVGFRAFQRNPIFGYGLGQSRFLVVTHEVGLVRMERNAHNVYLQTALDLGLFGLVPFLLLIIIGIWSGIRVARLGRQTDSRPLYILGWSLSTSVMIMAIGSFFQGNFNNRLWHIVLGLAITAANMEGLWATVKQATDQSQTATTLLGIARDRRMLSPLARHRSMEMLNPENPLQIGVGASTSAPAKGAKRNLGASRSSLRSSFAQGSSAS